MDHSHHHDNMQHSSSTNPSMGKSGHDHHKMMINDFKKRFWISLMVSIPVVVLAPMIQDLFGYKLAFPGAGFLIFILSSIVFFYGGFPFLQGLFKEVKNGADFNILQLNIDEPSGGVTTIPATLAVLTPWDQNEIDTTRSLLFTPKVFGPSNMVNGPFVIDGNSFDLNIINQTIPLNNVEIWEITNQTMIAHPFHIHDVQFYLLTRNGVPVPENERGRKDVVLIPPQFGSIRFITKFEDFADDEVPYMYHCHMLTHEDDGMMGQFTVVGNATGTGELNNAAIEIFPNPTSNAITIKNLTPYTIEIYNTTGQLIEQKMKIEGAVTYDLSAYAPGVYYFNIKTNESNHMYKIIKI